MASDEASCSYCGGLPASGRVPLSQRQKASSSSRFWDAINLDTSRWSRRTEARPSTTDKHLLLFWPWFVECTFQKHYRTTTLQLVDTICLPLSLLIWACCICTSYSLRWVVLTVAAPFAFELWCWRLRRTAPELYNKRRTTLTALRHLGVMPYLAFVLLRQPFPASSPRQAAVMLLAVHSGCAHSLSASFIFLNSWWVSVAALALSTPLLALVASDGCAHALAGPFPDAGWPTAAALMDRAALGVWRGSLARPDMAHVVCRTTLNTTLVVFNCLLAYTLHWLERGQRLRYKQQVPPAVAAMQPHLYGLPTGLVVAQALLFVLYPAMVLGWVVLGRWHGLYRAGPLAV